MKGSQVKGIGVLLIGFPLAMTSESRDQASLKMPQAQREGSVALPKSGYHTSQLNKSRDL